MAHTHIEPYFLLYRFYFRPVLDVTRLNAMVDLRYHNHMYINSPSLARLMNKLWGWMPRTMNDIGVRTKWQGWCSNCRVEDFYFTLIKFWFPKLSSLEILKYPEGLIPCGLLKLLKQWKFQCNVTKSWSGGRGFSTLSPLHPPTFSSCIFTSHLRNLATF